jgi:hypothetical protein
LFSQLDEKDIIFDWKHSSAVNHSIDPSLKKYTPTIEEIELAKSISIKYIDSLELSRKSKIKNKSDKLIDFEHNEYYRQYVGYYDKSGNKIIFINGCCESFADKFDINKMWVFVFGGGSCLFNALIDIDKKKCIDLNINDGM